MENVRMYPTCGALSYGYGGTFTHYGAHWNTSY